jgi:hypothetical protein
LIAQRGMRGGDIVEGMHLLKEAPQLAQQFPGGAGIAGKGMGMRFPRSNGCCRR